jgi:ABC-type transport system involved in multi-copper enzyme maturation permease subunit
MERSFEIYQNNAGDRRALPLGFSPVAAALSWVWVLGQRLWMEGVGMALANAVLIGVLYVNQAEWTAYLALQLLFAGVTGLLARAMRALSAERQGYAYQATIPARNGAGAIAKWIQVGEVPLPEWKARHLSGVPDFAPAPLRGMFAVALLTLKAAIRYRLVLVLLALLLGSVFALPAIIKHDGTANGFTQILLTYTLSSITAFLGFATLWLACGTLARDIDDFTMTMVATKPIPRWQIWMGKWLGIMTLNASMVFLAGAIVYGLLQARAGQLSEEQQVKLQNEVLVARSVARAPLADFETQTEQIFQERRTDPSLRDLNPDFLRQQIREQLQGRAQAVGPNMYRSVPWVFRLGPDARERLKDRPVFLRVHFFTADYAGLESVFNHGWEIGSGRERPLDRFSNTFGPETPIEFAIPSSQIDVDGTLTIRYANLSDKTVLFPLTDGVEVLHYEGGFILNYSRGLIILICWLGLLAAVGLFTASFLSFPVASFVSMAILVIGLSGGSLKQVVEQGGIMGVDHETGMVNQPSTFNKVAVSVYGSAHWVLSQISGFSPVSQLSTGRSISWGELTRAILVVIGIAGGGLALSGIIIFQRRELAMPS